MNNEYAEARALLRSRVAEFTTNEEERRAVLELCDDPYDDVMLLDLAERLTAEPEFNGVQVSPLVEEHGGMSDPPILSRDANGLTIRLGGEPWGDVLNQVEQRLINPSQRVHEVVVLKRRGFVIVDADEDVFVLTEEEYNRQVG